MSKILITGGNGFLGSHLINIFLKEKYNILILSRKNNNIEHLTDKIKFIKYESESYKIYKDVIHEFAPNIVIHCAWDGGNNYKNIDDINQFYNNIPQYVSLLEIINDINTKPHFIGIGSFAEYGTIYQPANELNKENPLSYYGLSKNICKNISRMFCFKNNIKWTWVLPCYIYGPNDVNTRFIPSLINNLLCGKESTFDECNVTIDYLYIDDFCKAILTILNTNTTGVINICSGNEYKLKDIILLLQNKINSKSIINFNSNLNKKNLSKYIVGNNEKLKNIGWSASIELEEGLEKTIKSHM